MVYVYIVECSDKTLYTGYTVDIEKRIKQHNIGKASKYTRGRKPVNLVYLESFTSKSEALKRENKIKSMTREEKLNIISLYLSKLI
ncbi:putative endonuclease containing a URI domain [Candidatus Syntrophocurvum alkaliphilum]|uniref:Putative endonuclease containing a URI domain n=1 Tax=Candidatus Syntrophocurvum alkaliphilum TaxID=2293317 RepID=A0A6I6DJE1_9FIRM|nr:GIY-YIG nuclease family protein [Candidatus Syntrophocurvum alkaliphilum]QGU00214.1 putative endonuclease containing a URI domain [Candidatus Syntrophocurvum alkaliphilum]